VRVYVRARAEYELPVEWRPRHYRYPDEPGGSRADGLLAERRVRRRNERRATTRRFRIGVFFRAAIHPFVQEAAACVRRIHFQTNGERLKRTLDRARLAATEITEDRILVVLLGLV
jgi:hypothetical protein